LALKGGILINFIRPGSMEFVKRFQINGTDEEVTQFYPVTLLDVH